MYLRMNSIKAAMGAYKALHGGWYKGQFERECVVGNVGRY